MVRILRWISGAGAIAGLVLVGFGYLGALHPAADSFAVFRLPLAILSLALLFPFAKRRITWAGFAIIAFACGPFLPAWVHRPEPPETAVTLYQKNMLFRPKDLAPLIADIRLKSPDFITLQEVSKSNRSLLTALDDMYPYHQFCTFSGVGGTVVMSRYPVQDAICGARGFSALRAAAPGQDPVWVVSVHLHWPWPYGQAAHVDRILPSLAEMDGPIVIAGDFNAVAWSHTLQRFKDASNTARIGHLEQSFTLPGGLTTTIDHVLGGAGQTEMRPKLGSDHRGIFATLSPGGRP